MGRIARLLARHRDALLLIVPVAVGYAVMAGLNVSERLKAIVPLVEFVQLDELLPALALAGVGYGLLLLRRAAKLRDLEGARLRAEAHATRLTTRDGLTGLLNRPALIEAMCMRREGGECVSVLAIDLDRFKPVNELHGNAAGDIALRTVAERLLRVIATHGVVGRVGGDDFACVIRHDGGSELPNHLAQAVQTALARPIQLPGALANVGASIGLATCDMVDRAGSEHLLRSAEFALRRAKRQRPGTICAFTSEDAAQMCEHASLELELRAAIHRGEFEPFFQPLVDLQTGEISGFEALARWRHPVRGLIGPDRFIGIAEESGLIHELALLILRRACLEARHWPAHTKLAVNISPLQLQDNWLPEQILRVLCTTGFAPGRLIVEITENRLVGDLESARLVLASLKNAGVQIALDDFGTGYASLTHLRELEFDRIKIDKSFIQKLDESGNEQIVRAVLRLSDGLGLSVTAEGVETAEVAARLAALGCHYGQGYYYSRPVDAQDARALVLVRPLAAPALPAATVTTFPRAAQR